MKHPGGRPSKLTPELIERLEKIVNDPSIVLLTDEDICTLLDIDDDTKRRWMLSESEDQETASFKGLIKKARVLQKQALHNEMRAGENGWQSKAWILERKFSDLNLKQISEVKEESKQDITVRWGGKKKDD